MGLRSNLRKLCLTGLVAYFTGACGPFPPAGQRRPTSTSAEREEAVKKAADRAREARRKKDEAARKAKEAEAARRRAREQREAEDRAKQEEAAADRKRRTSRTAAQIRRIEALASKYYLLYGGWPRSARSFGRPPVDGDPPIELGDVADGWARPVAIEWQAEERRLNIRSAGPDGKEGTSDDIYISVGQEAGGCESPGLFQGGPVHHQDLIDEGDEPSADLVAAAMAIEREVNTSAEAASFINFPGFFRQQNGLRRGCLVSMAGLSDVGLHNPPMASRTKLRKKIAAEYARGGWAGACQKVEQLLPLKCMSLDNSYVRSKCIERQDRLFNAKPIFLVGALATATYNGKRKRYDFEVRRLLHATGILDLDSCFSETCEGWTMQVGPFRVPGKKGNYRTWEARIGKALLSLLRPLRRFSVSEGEIRKTGSVVTFEDDVAVEALVQVKDRQITVVGDWFRFQHLQVRVLGLRAERYRNGVWARVLQKPRVSAKRIRCKHPALLKSATRR